MKGGSVAKAPHRSFECDKLDTRSSDMGQYHPMQHLMIRRFQNYVLVVMIAVKLPIAPTPM